MKKLMLLGGIRYLIPVIEEAHKLGVYVITVDNVESNIAHKYSDEFHNVSIVDKDAILTLAKELKIDGIMSFAVDPGVVTAAYVAEQMGLAFQCSYEVACILQDKAKFRKFLKDNNFNVPNAKGYNNVKDAIDDINYFNWPIIVKPVDSAGSKGVSKVDDPKDLLKAIDFALSCSISKNFIIEDFLEKQGCSSDTDYFVVNGELVFSNFSNQMFDENAENPYTPSAFSWPSTLSPKATNELEKELQRFISLLKIGTGIFNIETRLCTNGKTYIMELSPRGGGNRLSEVLEMAIGVKLISNAVKAAMGIETINIVAPLFDSIWHSEILFVDKEGVFDELVIGDFAKDYIVDVCVYIEKGDKVYRCTGANQAIGCLVYEFTSEQEYDELYYKVKEDVCIKLQ